MNQGSVKARQFLHRLKTHRLETGFSMLEAVVVVGVLLALAVSGFFSYGAITENAKMAKVKSSASEVHTGVLVASMDGDSTTLTQDVIDNWNASTDAIFVEILKPSTGDNSVNGDFCVQASNKQTPTIKARTGSCDFVAGDSGPNDLDGDGIPNSEDSDIDGDGIPNTEDSTPNGSGDNGTPAIPVGNQCVNMTVYEELSCWHSILMQAEADYEAVNAHYFGPSRYSYQESYSFNPTEMTGSALKWSVTQETYRDADSPEWDYNAFRTVMIDRDGNFWQGGYYHELNGPYSEADQLKNMVVVNYAENTETVINVKHACDFVTPDKLFKECSTAGIAPDKYLVTPVNSDSVAHDDIYKVIQQQVTYIKGAKELYGGYGVTVDTQSWAGTTYQSKIFNGQSGTRGYTRIMVVAPNGDLYTAETSFLKSNPWLPPAESISVFRYTPEHVDRVCTIPYTNSYNQRSDTQTCSSLGYLDFHA